MAQKADGTVYINSLMDTSGFKAGSKEIETASRRMASKVSQIGKSIKNAFSFFGKSGGGNAGEQFETIGEKAERLKESLKYLSDVKGLGFGNAEYDSVYQALVVASDELKNYRKELQESAMQEKNFSGNVGVLKSTLLGLRDAAHAPISMIKALGEAIKSIPTKSLGRLSGGFKKVGAVAKSAAKTIGRTLLSGIKKSATSMLGLGKSTDKTRMSLGRMLAMSLLFSTVFRAISTVAGGIKEGFQNLSQYSKETNTSISSLMSSLTQLKNSFATAFAPVLNVVAPILTAFINMVSKAVTYVGMLIAALTGQNSFVKATAVQEDYAASLGETSDQMADTADATKEAEKAAEGYLSPLDEINKFTKEQDNQSDNKDNGVTIPGYTAPTPQDMFETVPIENSIKGLADKIRSLIQSEDWEGLGAFAASKINAGLEKIYNLLNWDNVGGKITYFVDAFTTTFNSLVDNLDWDLLGRTVGTGINTVVNTLNRLIEGIDWVNLGKKLAVGVNGLVDEVDWTNLGRLIGNKFMILPKIALGFVKELDWSAIGTAIGDSLNGVVSTIDLSLIGELLGTALTGLFQTAINFSSTFDWKALGTNIYRGINTFFSTTDWSVIGKGISDFVKGLLDTLIVAVEGVDWKQIGESIKTLLVNVDWAGIVERIAELFGAACGGLAATVGGLIGDAFAAAKEYFQDKIEECGGNVVLGILKGILDGLAAIGQWIYDHVFIPFIEGFKSAFGINSPSTVMAEQGQFLMEGLFNGISSLVEKVVSIFAEIKEKISEKWTEVKTSSLETWGTIKTDLSEKWSDIKEKAESSFSKVREKITRTWEKVSDNTSDSWERTSEVVSDKASEVWDTITDTFSDIWDTMRNVGSDIVNGIIDGIASAWDSLVGWAQSILDLFSFDIAGMVGDAMSAARDFIGISAMPSTPVMPAPIQMPDIPYLAKGAVIPPKAPFLAILGDQRSGTNIEAPLSTIEDAVERAMRKSGGNQSGGTIHIHVDVSGREMAEVVLTELELKRIRSGQPAMGGA